MQRPLIKDGLVVNVVEFEPGTICCSKPELKAMQAAEEAEYDKRAAAWREEAGKLAEEIREAETQLSAARKASNQAQELASAGKGKADQLLKRVLETGGEVRAWEENLAALRARSLPARPTLVRPRRWIVPEGHSVGPAGGNIGDRWDGQAYIAPASKTDPEPAEKVA